MSEMTTSAMTAKIALVEISLAATVIPAAWPIAQIVYFNQCDPETIISTGFTWLELYDQLDVTKTNLVSLVQDVSPTQWSGDDREAFVKHIAAYETQLFGVQCTAMVVGVALICVGGILLALIIAYAVVSTVLAAFAAFIAAAGATMVGAPAAASAEATASSFAASALSILKGLSAAADAVGTGAAAAIAGVLAFDTGVQLGTGDLTVIKDLIQAFIDGLDNTAAGFASKFERDFVGGGIYSNGRHLAGSPTGPGRLAYGASTQTLPAGTDDEGNSQYGPGGVVDNIWSQVFDGDAWNH